ncbi:MULTISPECIES: ABC transporter permease [Halorussus]|uniref:ABC transporter permease n=1 Tax=Halorussus TaxID=1070314 RepID=UPI00209DEB07|nr:ABC transporter permease [Halorussus vallis]USZ76351.1 ABC transporter permease [Halorussus vallis]
MSRRTFVCYRLAGMVLTVWVVLTVAFAVIETTTDPMKIRVARAAAMSGRNSTEAVNTYLAATNQDAPVLRRYADWLVGVATFDLGRSFSENAPVSALVADRLAFTLVYFVPALVFAVVAGTATRLYTVAAEGTRLHRLTDGVSYVAVSIPMFLFAYVLKWWVLPSYYVATGDEVAYVASAGPLAPANLQAAVYPAVVMGLYLFGIQLRHSRTVLGEYASAKFVKTARMKGSGVWRVGRHIFRNAMVSVLSLFFVDLLGAVLLAVVVLEAVANVPGFGSLTLAAMRGGHDLPLMLGVSLFPVVLGVVANFLQDVGFVLLYPRIDAED